MRPSCWSISDSRRRRGDHDALDLGPCALDERFERLGARYGGEPDGESGLVPFSATNPIEPATLATTFPLSQVGL